MSIKTREGLAKLTLVVLVVLAIISLLYDNLPTQQEMQKDAEAREWKAAQETFEKLGLNQGGFNLEFYFKGDFEAGEKDGKFTVTLAPNSKVWVKNRGLKEITIEGPGVNKKLQHGEPVKLAPEGDDRTFEIR